MSSFNVKDPKFHKRASITFISTICKDTNSLLIQKSLKIFTCGQMGMWIWSENHGKSKSNAHVFSLFCYLKGFNCLCRKAIFTNLWTWRCMIDSSIWLNFVIDLIEKTIYQYATFRKMTKRLIERML